MSRESREPHDAEDRTRFTDESAEHLEARVDGAPRDADDPLSWFADESTSTPPADIVQHDREARPVLPESGGASEAEQAPIVPAPERLWGVNLPSPKWSIAALALAFAIGVGVSTWVLRVPTRLEESADRRAGDEVANRAVPAPEREAPELPAPLAPSPGRAVAPPQTKPSTGSAAAPTPRQARGNRVGEATRLRTPGRTVTATDLPLDRPRAESRDTTTSEAADARAPVGVPLPVTDGVVPTPVVPLPEVTAVHRPEAPPVAVLEEVAVRRTLDDYLNASGGLDVEATAQVWPTVNRQALARAFATLKSQDVTFQACDLDVASATAVARCRGVLQFVRKVGSPTPRIAAQQWTFKMRKVGGGWKIADVVAAPAAAASAQSGGAPKSPGRRE